MSRVYTRRQAVAVLVEPKFVRAMFVLFVLEACAKVAEAAGVKRVAQLRLVNDTDQPMTIEDLFVHKGYTVVPDLDYLEVAMWIGGQGKQVVGSPIYSRKNHLYFQVDGRDIPGPAATIVRTLVTPQSVVSVRRVTYSRSRARKGINTEPVLQP